MTTKHIHWLQLKDSDTISHSSHRGWIVTRDGETVPIMSQGFDRYQAGRYLTERYRLQAAGLCESITIMNKGDC